MTRGPFPSSHLQVLSISLVASLDYSWLLLIGVCVCVFACRGQRWSSLGVDPQAPSTLVLWDDLTGIGGLPVLDQASWPASSRDPVPLLSTAGFLSVCYCAWPFPWMGSGIDLSPLCWHSRYFTDGTISSAPAAGFSEHLATVVAGCGGHVPPLGNPRQKPHGAWQFSGSQ